MYFADTNEANTGNFDDRVKYSFTYQKSESPLFTFACK
jgi:hypothetical protein